MPRNAERPGSVDHNVKTSDDPDLIDLALRARVSKQRLCLGREADVSAKLADEQGSHAETVAGEQELVARTIPDGEREVSVEAP